MKLAKLTRIAVFTGFGVGMVLCANAENSPSNPDQEKLAAIAEAFVASHYPDFDKAGKKLVITDVGNAWEVGYQLPADTLGGTPILLIDKQSLQVVKTYRTQ